MLETTDGTPAPRGDRWASIAVGARVGRYEILELVGSGGMGHVYRARDLDLDREVAIKVVRSDLAGLDASTLLPEAQAMAKLSHPNVVVVYEVGTVDDRLFLAMEYVPGQTLRRWLGSERRPWREVLRALVAAARGLAAAHRAGIVHRDFKPDNVLVGADGRVRVVDFGLAFAAQGTASGGEPSSLETLASSDTVSFSAAAAGTPAYMSPEQHLQEPFDARADQFAFCVTLHEALFGRRPFSGATVGALRRSVLRRDLEPPPPGSPVPRWVRVAVLRGLAAAPAERFPSMDELIAALEADPAARRRGLAVGAALTAALGAGAYGLVHSQKEARCDPMPLAGIWDDTARARIRASFVATGRPYAEDSYARVVALLDDYTGAAGAMRVDACRATAVRHEQSPALLDARMACLDRRLETVRELAAVLGRADGPMLDRAVRGASNLDAISGCADAESLLAVPPPSTPEARARVAGLRSRLATADALRLAGRYKAGRALSEALVIEARAVGYVPAVAEAVYQAGAVARGAGDARGAEHHAVAALEAAARAKDGTLEARAYALLLYVVGWDLGRVSDALAMLPGANAAALHSGGDKGAAASLHSSIATALVRAGRTEDALRELDVAMGLLPPESLEVASTVNIIGVALRRAGRSAEALPRFEQARAIYEKRLGADHPDVAGVLLNIGTTDFELGQFAEAEVHQRRALALFERTLGPDHPDVARALNNLLTTLLALDQRDESLAVLRRALTIKEATLGRDHVDLSSSLVNLSHVLHITDHDDEALATAERALGLLEKELGPDNPQLVESLASGAEALLGLHRLAEARAHARRALELTTKDNAEGPNVAEVMTGLAAIDLAEGHPKLALADADRAIAIYDKRHDSRVAQPLIDRGRALRALGRGAEAEAALDRALAERGPEQARTRASVMALRAAR